MSPSLPRGRLGSKQRLKSVHMAHLVGVLYMYSSYGDMILHIICIGHCTACIYAIDHTVYRGSVYLGDQVLEGWGSLRQLNSLSSSGSDLKY